MFSEALHFIINIFFTLFGIALLLRAWMFAIRLHPFNPYAQAVLRVTNWLVLPMRRVIPAGNKLDWPSLVACWLTALLFLLLTWSLFMGTLPSLQSIAPALVAALLTVLKWAFNVILWMTLIQAVLSWVNPMAPIMPLLQTLTAPMLDPIRRVMPNLGGLDLSPLVLLIVAQVAMMVLQSMAFSLFGV
ncbi:YggT family protein [Parapusillimonas granuli]|uniref:YggT family protein n=1 Tax=Parapusillimonas granuli TaxID=380911 RepID=A0A853G1W2_9BURK|nr:YggT family protein [Parapusillimonas granuli]MBB5215838.1 YggT family protein [Parapusillimonas granuli]MEB2399471.1 YggT family protein [Alcaligenaceae bacterium]NYT50863.1 YggT family protein [Parapusillimonas granuli]